MTSLWLKIFWITLEGWEVMDEKHSSGYNVLLQALLMTAWEGEECSTLLPEFLWEPTPATMPTTTARRSKVARSAKMMSFFLLVLDREMWVPESKILAKACLMLVMGASRKKMRRLG